jgi:hypothetical protein
VNVEARGESDGEQSVQLKYVELGGRPFLVVVQRSRSSPNRVLCPRSATELIACPTASCVDKFYEVAMVSTLSSPPWSER